MNTLTYGVIEEIHSVGGITRTSYGIAAYADVDENGSDVVIASVCDVSSRRSPLEKLVEWCNLLQISPDHLCDVIEDFLSV